MNVAAIRERLGERLPEDIEIRERGTEAGWHRMVYWLQIVWLTLILRSRAKAIARTRSFSISLGRAVYLSDRHWTGEHASWWTDSVVVHEAVHARQWARFGPLFPLLYLLVLPVGVTFRAKLELDAYRAQIDYLRELGRTDAADHVERSLERIFSGPEYGWMDLLRLFR